MSASNCPECERQHINIGTNKGEQMSHTHSIKNIDDNATQVLEKRYLFRDQNNNLVETPEGMIRRVAKCVAEAELSSGKSKGKKSAEEYEEKFYNMMADFKFLPNSPTLMNAGTPNQMLSACFALPVEDSIESICETATNAIKIMKMGGGVGYNFSRLRARNSPVGSTQGVASGPVSFMTWYNSGTQVIAQGGRRRGANIGLLRVDHPDIMEFINCKKDLNNLNGFNISVVITDEFMKAMINNSDYQLISPQTSMPVGTLKALDVWNEICNNAWETGEPGLFFIDTVNRNNPTINLAVIDTCNPCGELPLEHYGSCNLGSINLNKFVDLEHKSINWKELETTVKLSVRFLDDVIDVNKFPIKKIQKETLAKRKIGLGIMGWADVLYMLKISYSDRTALDLAAQVMEFIDKTAKTTSIELAEEKGVFADWEQSVFAKMDPPVKIRNSTYTTVAPTGTISMIANCSSSIEPMYALGYTKTVMDGTRLKYMNFYFEDAMKKANAYTELVMKKVLDNGGSCQGIEGVPLDIQKVFLTAHDIPYEQHVKMQAEFQKHTTNSISKTINMKETASIDDVKNAFKLAWELGCKGITVYRDKCRDNQVLDSSEDTKINNIKTKGKNPSPVLPARRYRLTTSMGHVFVTVSYDEDGAQEVFTQIGKAGSELNAMAEGISRLISRSLAWGIPPHEIVKQLKDIKSDPCFENGKWIKSLPDAISQAMEDFIKWFRDNSEAIRSFFEIINSNTKDVKVKSSDSILEVEAIGKKKATGAFCPDCGSPLIYVETCRGGKCSNPSCGYSKC